MNFLFLYRIKWRVFYDSVGFFSCYDVERVRGAGRKCIFSISFLTKCRITWLLHFYAFLRMILFHLLHTIQSPVLVIWFLALWCLSGFWQAIHFSELLCMTLVRFCRTRKSLQFYIPIACTFSIPFALALPFPVIVWVISLREKHHYSPDLVENHHVLTLIWNQNFIKHLL